VRRTVVVKLVCETQCRREVSVRGTVVVKLVRQCHREVSYESTVHREMNTRDSVVGRLVRRSVVGKLVRVRIVSI
jgi:hypothetical protein